MPGFGHFGSRAYRACRVFSLLESSFLVPSKFERGAFYGPDSSDRLNRSITVTCPSRPHP